MPADTPSAPDAALREQIADAPMTLTRLKIVISHALRESGHPGFALYVPDIVAPAILAALSRDGGADGWRAGAEAMRKMVTDKIPLGPLTHDELNVLWQQIATMEIKP